ncbi:MAG: hypothetical protein ACYDH9_18795 [Limisphaerales bacterium]
MAWLEKQKAEKAPVTCAEAAEILRRADRVLNPRDREQIASGIEEARRRMSHEHLPKPAAREVPGHCPLLPIRECG